MAEPFRLARVLRLREQIRKLRSHEAEQLAARLGAARIAADVARLTVALDAKRAELLRERQEEEKYVRLAEAHRQRVLEEETHETERTLDEIAIDRHRRGQKERNDARR